MFTFTTNLKNNNMKKKIYYVVELELYGFDDSDVKETTGNKIITLYSIDNNEPKKIGDIDCDSSEKNKDVIQDFLNDNGYGDEEYDFIRL